MDRRVGAANAVVPRRDLEARRQTLDVPLPRARERLVEVVDVEDQPPLRRLEQAEVHEVRVAAELGRQAGVGRPGQVRRHEQRAATVEGAGRDEHASVADGDQVRHPVGRLLLEQADRVRAAGRRLPPRVRGTRRLLARRLAAGGALRRRELQCLGDLGQQFDHGVSRARGGCPAREAGRACRPSGTTTPAGGFPLQTGGPCALPSPFRPARRRLLRRPAYSGMQRVGVLSRETGARCLQGLAHQSPLRVAGALARSGGRARAGPVPYWGARGATGAARPGAAGPAGPRPSPRPD